MKTWITDRLPTAADANRHGEIYVENRQYRQYLIHWKEWNPELNIAFIPLNDLPPVPVVKSQDEKDTDAYIEWSKAHLGAYTWKDSFSAGVTYAREDLKWQVRELIKDFPHIGEVQQLRELVKET